MGDDTVRNFGVVIAICGALFIFGGTTFAVWTLDLEMKSDFGDSEVKYKFGATEAEYDGKYSGDSESETFEYEDDDCNCDDLADFFSNLKLMIYALIGCGIAIAYFGNSGDVENLPAVAGLTAVLSVAILAYTFTGLPETFEEETEIFEMLDEDPAFYIDEEKKVDGVDIHLKAMPYIGFFLPVVSLTLGGLLVKPDLMD